MDNINKRIEVNDNRILDYSIHDGYVPIITIREGIIEENNVQKAFRLSRWDDYGFNGWVNTDFDEFKNMHEVSFEFDYEHPLYIPLLHLLNGDKELIIDDDDTYEDMEKYMTISIDNDIITIKFINKLENDNSMEGFSVFIKNIGFDLRSKIDCNDLDTKDRLYVFFSEVHKLFMEEFHQITIEEYLLNKRLVKKK